LADLRATLLNLVERRWFVIERLPITRDGENGTASTIIHSIYAGAEAFARNASVQRAEAM
jgi:hypothetical protein